MEYGIQMYSVRDFTKDDLDGALRQVSQLGYKFVEFAGFFGHSAEAVRDMLDKYGLRVSGTHTGWQEVAEHFEETVAYHKIIGNKNIIVPGADLDGAFPSFIFSSFLALAMAEVENITPLLTSHSPAIFVP